MSTTVSQIMESMEILAPSWMAAPGDPIGLHAGHPNQRVRRLLLALDATQPVLREARAERADMILAHHPRFYNGLATLDPATNLGAVAHDLIRGGIALLCAHTNLDAAPGGVNDLLADAAGLPRSTEPIQETAFDPHLKLAVFVPPSHLDDLRDALCTAGAGCIGDYGDCTFRTPGVGTFRGDDSTTPFLGEAGRLEEVEEFRLETILPTSIKTTVLAALHEAHPYEEPAYDLYRLETGTSHGCGRIGTLPRAVRLSTLARRLKKATASTEVQLHGDPQTQAHRVAVWCGGGVPVETVCRLAPDTLVCGELRYHDAETLTATGISVLTLGHAPSEELILPALAERLGELHPEIDIRVALPRWPRARNL